MMHIPTKADIGFVPKPRGAYQKRTVKPYTPTKKALAVCDWFRINRDEELWGPDVCVMFDIANHTSTLRMCVRVGLITATTARRGVVTVYTAGPKL